MEIRNILRTGYKVLVVKQQTIMEIRNILRTGYKVLVVTVTLIEAIDLGRNLIGKCKNKKATIASDSVADKTNVESA